MQEIVRMVTSASLNIDAWNAVNLDMVPTIAGDCMEEKEEMDERVGNMLREERTATPNSKQLNLVIYFLL